MKIAILCASGKAGKAITKAALKKDLDVVYFVRDSSKMNEFVDRVKVVQKDLFY